VKEQGRNLLTYECYAVYCLEAQEVRYMMTLVTFWFSFDPHAYKAPDSICFTFSLEIVMLVCVCGMLAVLGTP